jgi:hypothetical protein
MRIKIKLFLADSAARIAEMRRLLPTIAFPDERERQHYENQIAQLEAMRAYFLEMERGDARAA